MARLDVNFISYTLRRAVDITVIIPSVTIPESMSGEPVSHKHEPFPVLYLLHGYGNNHATWCGYSNIEMYAEERQIAVVMLGTENKAYLDLGGEDNYYTFVSKELPEYVKATFPVSDRPEDTYICGLSMGGFGAVYHGLRNPENFAAIGTLSGAVMGMPATSDKGERPNPLPLLEELAKEGKKIPTIYLACGNEDFLLEDNHKFVDAMERLGVDCTYEFVDGYKHEWRFWDLEVERFLDWIKRSDAYAGKKRGV